MASKDFDGTNLMILGEGANVALVVGERSYNGTLCMRVDGFQESWFIKLSVVHPGEPDEILIHKIVKEPQHIQSANALAVDGDGKALLEQISATALSPEMAEKIPYEPEDREGDHPILKT